MQNCSSRRTQVILYFSGPSEFSQPETKSTTWGPTKKIIWNRFTKNKFCLQGKNLRKVAPRPEPQINHLRAAALFHGKEREATTRGLCRRGVRLLFYHFMQSTDMFKNGCVLPRMSEVLSLVIFSEAHFESSVCLQK